MSTLTDVARRCDQSIEEARRELVTAVREAHRYGMTQQQIALAIGRSQPEVSRLLRFHGTTPHARILRKHRSKVLDIVGDIGGRNVRVFGSVATGHDTADSDIDLLIDLPPDRGLMALTRAERQVSEALGIPVDIVPTDDLRPEYKDRAMGEAVPL